MENVTTSKALKKLILFSVPLILSGLLQQLFNWVDALIVGNFIGETALGGVGATSSIYNLFVNMIVGFTSGLTVLFAENHGRGKTKENRELLSEHSLILCLIFTVISVIGILFSDGILTVMDTPEAMLLYAKEYLRVLLIGIPFLSLYNTYSALLRGMGNSIVPFTSVLISSAVNAVLDYVFIVFLNFGVSGAAAATVISQIAMTIYVVIYTSKKHPYLVRSHFKPITRARTLRSGGGYGIPPALQSSISSIGNLFLQKFMNGFGDNTVSAITTAYRVDSVLFLPIINLSAAISTLVAQENGSGRAASAKRIFGLGTVVMSILSLILTATILLSGKALLGIFGLTQASVEIGGAFFKSISVFYIVYGIAMSIKGYAEGNGDMLFSGVIGVCSLGVRILCSYAFADAFGNMVVAYAEAFSWIFMLIAFALRTLMRNPKGAA